MNVTGRPVSRDESLFDSSVVREWYTQLAEASKTPGLVQHLVRRTGELMPRFVASYDKLRALPRRIRRALGRGGLSLARAALLLALCGGPLHAALIPVDGTTCTLADAIVAANTDTATGGCPAGAGTDRIRLDADVTLGASLPSLTSSLRIQAGAGSILDGSGNSCLVVTAAGNVSLRGLTIQNCVAAQGGAVHNQGTLAVSNCTISGNTATGSKGGGIYNQGSLSIDRTVISDNTAAGYGGGVANMGAGGSNVGRLTISGSAISGNTADEGGGGIHTDYGSVKISSTTITGNQATASFSDGGGVMNYGGQLTCTRCTISGNTASRGGGVITGFYFTDDFDAAVVTMRKSTISGNEATTRNGGGVMLYQRGALVLTDSTVSGNSAGTTGGGVGGHTLYEEGFLTVTNSTISGNSAGLEGGGVHGDSTRSPLVTMKHALVSGNTASTVAEMSLDGSFSVSVNDYNLFGSNGDAGVSGFTPGATDIVPAPGVMVDDILEPLANNGGATLTHALVPGGPAVDAVPSGDGNCIGTTDQRGVPRPQGSGCDVGSFELEAP